jgi:thiol:disulfide interchange protein DsbA
MKRREVIKSVAGVVGALSLPTIGWSQDAKTYKTAKRETQPSTQGKIDVVEFFWYGCHHCYDFEPKVNAWVKTLPADVVFKKVHIRWPTKRINFEGHQKLYYTLEAMGKLPTLHAKVFEAMHKDKKQLANDVEIFDLMQSLGLNREEFAKVFNSFAVNTQCAKAVSLMEAYDIEGVPTVGVGGRYSTTASIAGSEEKVLEVANLLIKKRRQGQ